MEEVIKDWTWGFNQVQNQPIPPDTSYSLHPHESNIYITGCFFKFAAIELTEAINPVIKLLHFICTSKWISEFIAV